MPYQPDSNLAKFIQDLPKTETHIHIEGALPFHLLQGIDGDRFQHPPDSWADDYKFGSFKQFEDELIAMAMAWYTTPERYHEAAAEIFRTHLDQNVKYVEISFHSGIIDILDIPGPEIISAIKEAVPDGLEVRVFMGILRQGYNEKMGPVLEESITWKGLDGIDLHGPESPPIEAWAKRLWPAAREAGKFTKAHAGEFCGSDYVRDAIEQLGVRRIEHGVSAVENPQALQLVQNLDVTFDVCPISNVKLDVVPSMSKHPIRRLFDIGVRCTVNTDDPLSFGNRLCDEYAALSIDLGFSERELAMIARNGFQIALMSEKKKEPWLRQLDAIIGCN